MILHSHGLTIRYAPRFGGATPWHCDGYLLVGPRVTVAALLDSCRFSLNLRTWRA